jgi:phosphate transport system protein
VFTNDLRELLNEVMILGSMVERAIDEAIVALRDQDVDRARAVISGDDEINRRRWQLEEESLRLMALQAPMAGDLRRIAAVMHVATDLERMADHAEGISHLVIRTADEPLLKPLLDIPRMATIARKMLLDAVEAFVEDDAVAARAIAERDDEVDLLYDQIYHELLTYMLADPTTISRATHLLWAAHNIERVGDRVTNICERVVFVVTGSIEELNRI